MGGAKAVAHQWQSKFLISEGSSREIEMAFPSMEFFSIKICYLGYFLNFSREMFMYAVYFRKLGMEEALDVCFLVNCPLGSELNMTMTF